MASTGGSLRGTSAAAHRCTHGGPLPVRGGLRFDRGSRAPRAPPPAAHPGRGGGTLPTTTAAPRGGRRVRGGRWRTPARGSHPRRGPPRKSLWGTGTDRNRSDAHRPRLRSALRMDRPHTDPGPTCRGHRWFLDSEVAPWAVRPGSSGGTSCTRVVPYDRSLLTAHQRSGLRPYRGGRNSVVRLSEPGRAHRQDRSARRGTRDTASGYAVG